MKTLAQLGRFRDPLANALGVVLPAALAVALTPWLLAALGPELFGFFSLQTAALMLLGVNDFGISRAVLLTGIARGGAERDGPRVAAVWRGLHLSGTLSAIVAVAGLIVGAVALRGAEADIRWSSGLTLVAACVSLLALPFRASMEIERRFVRLNLIRGTAAGLLFAGPALALVAERSLTACALAVLASRAVMLAVYAADARVPLRGFGRSARAFAARLARGRLAGAHRELTRRAGWLGVAGAVASVVGYLDRIIAGAIAGPAAVASYAVASEAATKVWLGIGAFTSAEMPRLAAAWDGAEVRGGGLRFLTWAASAIGLGSLMVALFAGERLLQLWLGAQARPDMGPLLRLLTLGIAINCLTQVNFILLLLTRRERSAAFMQFYILPATAAATAAAVAWAGVTGAAAVFVLRLAADAFLVRWMLVRQGGPRAGVGFGATAGWVAGLTALWAAREAWG